MRVGRMKGMDDFRKMKLKVKIEFNEVAIIVVAKFIYFLESILFGYNSSIWIRLTQFLIRFSFAQYDFLSFSSTNVQIR